MYTRLNTVKTFKGFKFIRDPRDDRAKSFLTLVVTPWYKFLKLKIATAYTPNNISIYKSLKHAFKYAKEKRVIDGESEVIYVCGMIYRK